MIPLPSTGSMQLGSTMEPAEPVAIVRNFNKGLMQVRSTVLPLAPPFVVRKPIRVPKLALLAVSATPRKGLCLSALLHTAVAAMVISVPILFPGWLVSVPSAEAAADLDREVEYQPLLLPILPAMSGASADAKIEHGSGRQAHSMVTQTLPIAARPTANQPKPDYAGPQLIVSNPPDSTKGVQTVRRPDLVAPPKMSYPLRVPSMVVLPHRAIRAPVAPRFEQPVPSNPEMLSRLRAIESPVPASLLPVDKPKLSLAPARPVLPKIRVASEPSVPVLAAMVDADVSARKAVAIINAVSVPPEPDPLIPEAELASRFVVGPSGMPTTVAAPKPKATAGNLAGPGVSTVKENLPQASVENGTGTRVDAGDGHAGVASTESSASASPRPGSGAGAASAVAAGNKGLPGISISGGMPGRSGRAAVTNPIPHGSYALTIISGGSSGGASRDLGVFSRSDTVYTVYIPMTDAGGGPDWPMQYALMSPAQAHNGSPNGLLTPPAVLRKSQATAPKTGLAANSGPVFVTGIIDENGKLGALRAVRDPDGRTQSALNALARWEFLAAHLGGKPVACKILIGVSVLPAEEVGK